MPWLAVKVKENEVADQGIEDCNFNCPCHDRYHSSCKVYLLSRLVAQDASGIVVHPVLDTPNISNVQLADIRPLGDKPANQFVRVLVAPPLPCAVWMRVVARCAGTCV